MANEMTTQEQGAKERAAELAGSAKQEARGVAGDARQEASAVVSEAGTQVSNLVGEAKNAVHSQASDSTSKAVDAISGLSTRLRALADGDTEHAGDLRRYAGDLSDRLGSVADRLGERGFDGMVDDVQRFARRRPGLFLAAAATTGFLAGRMFRGAQAQSSNGGSEVSTGQDHAPVGVTAGAVPAAPVATTTPPAYGAATPAPAAPPVADYGAVPGTGSPR